MKFIECLKEWNGGISRGARAKLAKVLKVTETTVIVITGNNNSQNVNTASPGVTETEVKEMAGEIKQMKKDIQILNLKMDLMLEKMKDK